MQNGYLRDPTSFSTMDPSAAYCSAQERSSALDVIHLVWYNNRKHQALLSFIIHYFFTFVPTLFQKIGVGVCSFWTKRQKNGWESVG